MMTMTNVDKDLTRFMMQFCYNCDDAMYCTTEACKACLTNRLDETDEEFELMGNQFSF